jgi:1-deoxy-D-xylulose-5-phosphate reductoisomerase
MDNLIQVSILGSTGTIGINTLDVIERHSDVYQVFAISGWNNLELICEQIIKFNPKYAVVSNINQANILNDKIKNLGLNSSTKILHSVEGLCYISSHESVSIVMAAIVGSAGLEPTLQAVKSGKKVLLANKESLVAAGQIFTDAAKQHNAQILPVDSEHNAIYQCYNKNGIGVKSIILTASGGPFLNLELDKFQNITPEMACNHPKWKMGRKISVDSATMLNKGLELIEAYWLFPDTQNNIQIVVHPQSIVHSLVEYVDGSILAQLSYPDMRIPIAYSLAYPQRIESGAKSLDISQLTSLNFYQPNLEKFPCIKLAYQALDSKQCITLNAANEIAVSAFLENKISFLDISKVIESILNKYNYNQPRNIEDIIDIDKYVRNITEDYVNKVLV